MESKAVKGRENRLSLHSPEETEEQRGDKWCQWNALYRHRVQKALSYTLNEVLLQRPRKKDDDNLITTCQSLSGQWPTFAAQNGGEDVKTREKVSSRCTRLNFSLER